MTLGNFALTNRSKFDVFTKNNFRERIDLNHVEEDPSFDNDNLNLTSSRNVFNSGKIIVSWMKCMCLQPRINPQLQEERKLVVATSKVSQ